MQAFSTSQQGQHMPRLADDIENTVGVSDSISYSSFPESTGLNVKFGITGQW
jgi:hypothetical protein